MPNDEYYFYANLNFIFNYNEANKTILDRNKSCNDKISFIQNKTKNIASKVRTLQFNDSLKTQVLRQITNIDTVITGFSKKIKNSYDTISFVKKEANKLSSSKEPIGIKFKKSQILFEKLTNKHSQIDMIEKILFSMEKHLNSITLNGNILRPSLDKILDILKKCLKETEEHNISKLKRAQQQFEKSKELNDFMYGKRNPKLAHLLSLDSAVPVDADVIDKKTKKITKPAIPSKLMTPFGPVWVKRSNSDSSRMIYLIYLNQQCSKDLKYDEMCKELDWKFNSNFNSEIKDLYRKRAIEGIIKPIIKYISQPLTKSQNTTSKYGNIIMQQIMLSTVKYNYPISRYLTKSQKEAAAFLCGVLLLSESHEFRNPTGGKFERKAMKNVLRLAKNGCLNPFSKVFSNAKGRYIPAHNKSENEDEIFPGGQRQASMLINLHAIKYSYLCANALAKNIDANSETFKTDYINKVTTELIRINDTWNNRKVMLLQGKISPRFKTNPQYLDNKLTYDQFAKGFKFLNKFKTADKDDTFDIDELPDKPANSLLSSIKILTKMKNIKKVNKLLNNSL